MKVFRHEGQNFIGFQAETEEERDIILDFVRDRMGKKAWINHCSDPKGGFEVAISFHPEPIIG
jgi:hypothetical protein